MFLPSCRNGRGALAIIAGIAGTVLSAGHARADAPVPAAATAAATYQVRHTLTVKDIPAGAKKLRVWFWIPQDEEGQKVLDLSVARAPAGYAITRDPVNGHCYLYAEIDRPAAGDAAALVTDFRLRRTAVRVALDPGRSEPLTALHRATFADSLRRDVPHMEVDARIESLARKLCGGEANVVKQARLLYDYVIDHAEHYSKRAGAPESSNCGDAGYCLAQGGGACTDLHALFSALARSRGIPTRLMFGSRLAAQNENKDTDPGYRCWVQFFAPGYGWVPCDIAAADTNPGKRDYYFGGLDERRVLFSNGRNLVLAPRQAGAPLNLFIRAHVEVDGAPHGAFERTLRFATVPEHPVPATIAVTR